MTLTPRAIREYDERAPEPEETETATFGLGCFWGPDASFGALDGVVRTRAGYAGGTKTDPTYQSLGDHTEVVQVAFDPDAIGYADLVERVFRQHDPHSQTRKAQYQNVVLTETRAQGAALAEFLRERGLEPDAVGTRIEQLSRFYPAEAYHQKYKLRSEAEFMDAFDEAGYDDAALRESPAAAKLNGYVAGNGSGIADELLAAE
ncbi:peptide-methionine (S)-S-oxide reductase [Halorubrum ejinorense]|uniref:peptide-methionine (S)-S-oxide reductase n=1 Tax=Halorubrum ejinorense TaxID=425309 RepID=A0AAV3SVR4_9EURY